MLGKTLLNSTSSAARSIPHFDPNAAIPRLRDGDHPAADAEGPLPRHFLETAIG